MNQDQLVALSDKVPAEFSNPLVIGALRTPDAPMDVWVKEARNAIRNGKRVVLVGDLADTRVDRNFIANSLFQLTADNDEAHFALMLHWTQALRLTPPAELFGYFDTVYVAVDGPITREQVVSIQNRWGADWVLLPSVGVAWKNWIANTLFPEKVGSLRLLTPNDSTGVNFLQADELRLTIEELQLQFPQIRVRPAPSEWFVASEIGPWRLRNRDADLATKIRDTRSQTSYPTSVVIPFHWTGNSENAHFLNRCIESIRRTFPDPGECEVILAIDTELDEHPLLEKLSDTPDLAIVKIPRVAPSDALAATDTVDWRAGYIRNVGASFASSSHEKKSTLIFIDSDAEVLEPTEVRRAIQNPDFDVLQLVDETQAIGFESATSMFIAVDRDFFLKIGGFANAFSQYGAEDNFFVWKAERRGGRILPLAKSTVQHMRAPRDSDDPFLKMIRLRKSAQLMYRMTLDPRVHRHFFVSAGNNVWMRGLCKWTLKHPVGRFLWGPFVFVGTLIESDRRIEYLASFYATCREKAAHITRQARPLLARVATDFDASLRQFYGTKIKSNLWFFEEPTAWIRAKTPNFYRWVWRPVLKARFFLEHHLINRWRKL